MNAGEWEKVKTGFLTAVALEARERESFLSRLEGSDPAVARMVSELLSEPSGVDLDLRHPCWSVDESPHVGQRGATAFEPGQVLMDRFEIQAFLGAGGLGEVYRALDRWQMIVIAIKTPLPGLASKPEIIEALRGELNTARAVTHPNICRLYDIHFSEGGSTPPFFTMEFVDGLTLKEHLRATGPLDLVRARAIAEQLADALDAAHAKGIVHRDFKTNNVMITADCSRVVVMDFGLAREVAGGTDLQTTLTAIAGTPAYMAPEQLRGAGTTFAADIYSLGVVLFEIVTGKLPFEGNSPLDVALRRMSDDAPSPRRFQKSLPRAWEHAILRCLERDPARRPGTARAAVSLLDNRGPWFIRRRSAMLSLASLPVAAAVGALGFVALRPRPLTIEVFDFANEANSADQTQHLCTGLPGEMIRRLSCIHGVVAIPRYTTRRGAERHKDTEYAFDGTIEADEGHYRFNVHLIRNPDEQVIWAGKFDRKRGDDRLDVEGEVARSAVLELRNLLTLRTRLFGSSLLQSLESAAVAPTGSGAAFDHYLRGIAALKVGTVESIDTAVELLEQAVGEDARFGLAYAALAEADLARLNFGDTPERQYMYAARLHAERAVQVTPDLAEAHAMYGAVLQQAEWNWQGAEASYNQALRLKENFPRALRWRAGLHLQFARFDEAVAGMNKAYELDAYNQPAIAGHGLTFLFADRAEEAVRFLEANIGGRSLPIARYNLAQAYGRLGSLASGERSAAHFRRALEEAAKVQEAIGAQSPLVNQTFALCHSLRGDVGSAQPYLVRLKESANAGRTSPLQVAMVLAVQHQVDEALHYVERALAVRARNLIYLRVNVFLEAIRNQPRYQAVMRHLALTA